MCQWSLTSNTPFCGDGWLNFSGNNYDMDLSQILKDDPQEKYWVENGENYLLEVTICQLSLTSNPFSEVMGRSLSGDNYGMDLSQSWMIFKKKILDGIILRKFEGPTSWDGGLVRCH